ncbi:MAG: SIMPL domain-containing protein [Patescibacteria group bacterium]
MSENFPKQVKAGALILIAFSALAFVYQYGRSVNQQFPNKTFSVDGESKLDAPNNIATFTASVVTEGDKDVTSIQTQNTEKMNAIIAYLKEQGVEKKDLQTQDYNLTPRYEYSNCTAGTSVCPPPAIVGYTLSQALVIKVRNLDTVGTLLSGLVEKGANTVSNVSFTSDTDENSDVRSEARKEAVEKARAKAESIAKAGGFRVGRVVSLYEDQTPVDQGDMMYGRGGGVMEATKSAAPVPPTIEPGSENGKVRVTITYEILN